MKKLKTLLALALGLAVINTGCTTTKTTTADGVTTQVTRFDTQDAAEALALANAALSNPLVSNLVYNAIQPK